MKKTSVAAIALILFSGCGTLGQMEDGLNALMGKEARVAFDVLGNPYGKRQSGGDTVYYWFENSYKRQDMSDERNNYGSYDRRTNIAPIHNNCLIKLVADSSDRLIKWEYDGDIGGCYNYIGRLKGYTDNTK